VTVAVERRKKNRLFVNKHLVVTNRLKSRNSAVTKWGVRSQNGNVVTKLRARSQNTSVFTKWECGHKMGSAVRKLGSVITKCGVWSQNGECGHKMGSVVTRIVCVYVFRAVIKQS
jgi:hypothetical protein